MQASKLHIHSLGIVAANKVLSSNIIEVSPIEDTPMVDGELTDSFVDLSVKSQDAQGGSYESAAAVSNTVQATWLPLGSSNRMTPPDVRRGETVALWRFADTDKYYWCTLKDDMHLRKLETVIWAFSATTDEGLPTTSETAYFVEISTHKKLLHIHTTKENGEPFAYDIQLNTDEGFFTIQDDAGNSIQLDSMNRRIQMFNRDGSVLDIDKTKIMMSSKDLIDLKSKDINLQSQTYQQKATTNSIEASTQTIKAQTTHIGNFTLAGGLSAGPGSSGSGVAIDGAVAVTQDVVAGGISLINHTHPGDGEGPVGKPM